MELIDWIILIGSAAIVAGVFIAWLRRRKTGKTGCGCGCAACPHGDNCPSKRKEEK